MKHAAMTTVIRYDTYTKDRETHTQHVHALNDQDTTAQQRGGYNPRCSFCWLGHPHTTALHEARIGEALKTAN